MMMLRFIIALLGFLTFATIAFGQKRTEVYNAEAYYESGDYFSALKEYKVLYSKDTSNAHFCLRIGACMYNLRYPADSIWPYLLKASSKNIPEAFYYQGKLFHLSENFDEEIKALNHYLNSSGNHPFTSQLVQRDIEIAKYAIEALKNPVPVVVENLGPEINSAFPDYAPLISADERFMFFTSRRPETTGALKDELGSYFEDIYSSVRVDENWSKAVNVQSPLNTQTNDACTGLSPDGNMLILYRTQANKLNGDLYLSVLNDKTWSEPIKLNSNINSPYVETSACISIDNQTIYFSSDRPGGQGGKDIYMARMLPSGEWGKAINLGPTINTPFDEDAPFIHPDGNTLYFSSKGHNTIGGYDVFKTEKNEEGFWTEPLNMGYPVNTTDDDIFFVLSPDNRRGYISGRRKETIGSYDIYRINFQSVDKEYEVLTGKVCEEGSDKIYIPAKITIVDESAHSINGIYNSNPRNGKFIFLFNPNKRYKIVIEAEGYNPIVTNLSGLQYPIKEGKELVFMMSKRK